MLEISSTINVIYPSQLKSNKYFFGVNLYFQHNYTLSYDKQEYGIQHSRMPTPINHLYTFIYIYDLHICMNKVEIQSCISFCFAHALIEIEILRILCFVDLYLLFNYHVFRGDQIVNIKQGQLFPQCSYIFPVFRDQ